MLQPQPEVVRKRLQQCPLQRDRRFIVARFLQFSAPLQFGFNLRHRLRVMLTDGRIPTLTDGHAQPRERSIASTSLALCQIQKCLDFLPDLGLHVTQTMITL